MKTTILSSIVLVVLLSFSCTKDDDNNGGPVLDVNKTSIDFGDAYQGDVLVQTFKISNDGEESFNWTSTIDETWVSLNVTGGTVGSSDVEVTVTLDTSPLDVGSHTCTIAIISEPHKIDGSPTYIVVSVNITERIIAGHELTEDETWSGNLTLKGDIRIPDGITLTIMPGTVIRVSTEDPDWDEGYEDGTIDIYSSGNIIANGTEDQIIVLTSDDDTPIINDWWGIGLSHGSSTELSYCCIAYSYIGLFIFNQTAETTIEHCMFAYTGGISDWGPDVTISHSTFIYGEDGYERWEEGRKATLSYCVFEGNSMLDVEALDSYCDVTINHSNFADNEFYNLYIGWFFDPVDVVITANQCYGIVSIEDNDCGTITVNNPAASPVPDAGCGFELSELPVKSTFVDNKKSGNNEYTNRTILNKGYHERDASYQW
ncbi:MAG: hypothetical protein JXA61_05500 [Bacteroidales bacterium]|nr:hypothetical protein [Bacteroidales bacterium]